MNWQIIGQIIGYVWLFLTLLFLFSIWRSSRINSKAVQTLSAVALQNAESVKKVADTVYILAQHLEKPPI